MVKKEKIKSDLLPQNLNDKMYETAGIIMDKSFHEKFCKSNWRMIEKTTSD